MRTATAVTEKELNFTLSDIVSVNNALAQLLAEETALVGDMQISKVGELQERKLKLTSLLERYTRYFIKNREKFANITAQEIAALKASEENLQKEMKKNYEKLLVARAVNQAIVTCVTGIFAKKAGNTLYNASGAMYKTARFHAPMSMTLNRMI
jgi:hypothetical protein